MHAINWHNGMSLFWPLLIKSRGTFYCIQQEQRVKLTTYYGSAEMNLFNKMNEL